eukprot:6598655-Lingulodinium_polyedra.AAC.1
MAGKALAKAKAKGKSKSMNTKQTKELKKEDSSKKLMDIVDQDEADEPRRKLRRRDSDQAVKK